MWVRGAFCRGGALCCGMEHQGDGPCRSGQYFPLSHRDWVDNPCRQSGQNPVHVCRVFGALGKRKEHEMLKPIDGKGADHLSLAVAHQENMRSVCVGNFRILNRREGREIETGVAIPEKMR